MKLKKGDNFNGGIIRVDNITDTHIIIAHIPTGLQHTISKAQAQDHIDTGLWVDNATWQKANYTIY